MARAQGDVGIQWGSWTAMTWTSSGPDGIANSARSGASDALDLTALDNVEDVLVALKGKTLTGTLGSVPVIQLLAGAEVNANYPAGYKQYAQVGPGLLMNAANTTEYGAVYSLASAFGHGLPGKVKFIVDNATGLTLAGTSGEETENTVYYQVIYRNIKPTA